jgi:exonuclease III|uniref:Endonuclease/exonuclease/phosphatase domain-containing protein n=1 Tax=viral metagenome TaxID=1070528 RepID=A0A6C0CZF9_9ZZZZ
MKYIIIIFILCVLIIFLHVSYISKIKDIIPYYHPLIKTESYNLLPRSNIRILTYNIFLRPPLVSNNGNDYKDERLALFCGLLNDYDIICLQEIFSFLNFRRNVLIKIAKKFGFFYNAILQTKNSIIDGGLLVLSRFPISETTYEIYTDKILSDAYVDKGCLYTRIHILDNIDIHLFTTHTQASYISNITQSREIRNKQIIQLHKFITEKLNKNFESNDLVLLVGDLNVNSRPKDNENCYDTIEYLDMMKILSFDNNYNYIDLLKYDNNGIHPVTYGDIENVLTHSDDLYSKQSIDYILEIKPLSYSHTRSINVIPGSCTVEKMLVKNRQFSQLSDHYGVSCLLSVL